MDATLPRRAVLPLLLAAAGTVGLSACNRTKTLTVSTTPPLDMERLQRDVTALAARVSPGRLGVGLMNLESGQYFAFSADQRFPLQSVFKLLLAAAVLSEVDDGRLSLEEHVILDADQLSPPWSPISAAWPDRRDYTVADLLKAALDDSDNTAADVLMKRIGGPGALTGWIRHHRLEEPRVDRYERELQAETRGVASFRPAWAQPAAWSAARDAVPLERRRAAIAAYLSDPRDTITPRAMLAFLRRLHAGELLSPRSTAMLLRILFDTRRGEARLKAGLPAGSRFAHKTGTSGMALGVNLAFNDVGIAVLPDKRSYAMAAFLAGSALDADAADALMADLARALIRGVG